MAVTTGSKIVIGFDRLFAILSGGWVVLEEEYAVIVGCLEIDGCGEAGL